MRHRRQRSKKILLFVLCTTTGLFGTGCQQIQAIIQMVMSAVGGGGFNPPGSGGGGGILPPGLTGGGGPLSPNSSLPPPPASQQTIQQIVQDYGVPITGSQATPEALERIVFAMRGYKKEHYRGLTEINVTPGGGSISGLWQSWGRGAKITLYARSSSRYPVSRHTTSHEIGHHASLFSREEVLGDPLSNALGTSVNAFPTGYSYTNDAEKLAENIAFILLGKDCESSPRPSWRPTVAAMQIMEGEFGRSWGTQGAGTGTSLPPATGTSGSTGTTGSGGPTATTPTRPGTTS